jgi:hypothetical protein
MRTAVDGIVERYAPGLCGHGDHGLNILLKGDNTLYYFSGVRTAYSDVHNRPSSSNSTLVELTSPGDHITFDIERNTELFFQKAIDKSLRNWTVEARLSGVEVDITPAKSMIEAGRQRIDGINSVDI